MTRITISTVTSILALFLLGSCENKQAEHQRRESDEIKSSFRTNGLSMTFDGDWEHVEEDSFGYVIRPKGEKHRKIRVHPTRFQGSSTREALDKTSERTKSNGDVTLDITDIKTNSGINLLKASVSKAGNKVYLERYFYRKPTGEIICICVYSYHDVDFSKSVEQALKHTLEKSDEEVARRVEETASGKVQDISFEELRRGLNR